MLMDAGKGQRPFDVTVHSVPLEEIKGGGPPRDGIPALNRPRFVSAAEANKFLRSKDRVLGVAMGSAAKAYPIKILNWHEVVNDDLAGRAAVVTWCPLCSSGVVYSGEIEGKRFDFGVSGKLYKSGLVMYDRQSDSLWSQILQQAITGPMTGTKLSMLPAENTTWTMWRSEHQDTLVLSTETGFKRDYGLDPYQRYLEEGTPIFRAEHNDSSHIHVAAMERILGVQMNRAKKAYPFSVLKKEPDVFEDNLGGTAIFIHFDRKSETAFATDNSGTPIPSIVAFWFAWHDFYPDTAVASHLSVVEHH